MKRCFITALTVLLLCCGSVMATGIQFYWATSEKVFLWNSPDDEHPVLATLNSATNQWTIDSQETSEQWRDVLRTIARQFIPDADVNRYSSKDLWQVVLNKL